ncbi:alpha/beta hydrolase [Pseudoalteromonas sp. GCY]|uniref:alpha/beta hydrolase n=1 Tax=Pseudoalteromonas sp. GCY TaxID=2003316 RepID=UPI001F1DC564|nr:alpha/beta hydrolase [Pseudoalteromonas sp. GCY]
MDFIRSIFICIFLVSMVSSCTSIGRSIMHSSLNNRAKFVINYDYDYLGVVRLEKVLKSESSSLIYDFYPADRSVKGDFSLSFKAGDLDHEYSVVRNSEDRPLDLSQQLTILIPGFAIDKSFLISYAVWFSSMGSDVVVMDLYGVKEDSFTFGSKLADYYPEITNGYDKVNIVGFSMGFLPVLDIANKYRVNSLIGVVPLLSREDLNLAASEASSYVELLPNSIIKNVIDEYISENKINDYFYGALNSIGAQSKMLIIQAENDKVLPDSSLVVFEGDKADNLVLSGYNHYILASMPTPETTGAVIEFLNNSVGTGSVSNSDQKYTTHSEAEVKKELN